ncbi:MAG TPA: hypothetical protein VK784_01255, partial [Pseudonocardiaceae bacterium]|nr:hypothetical protein [Pseudonocardiaceae bacterium]
RRELLEQGRALPPDPGRFPIRPGSREDIHDAAEDSHRIPEGEQDEVRAHVTRWAVHDGTTDALPEDWKVEAV